MVFQLDLFKDCLDLVSAEEGEEDLMLINKNKIEYEQL